MKKTLFTISLIFILGTILSNTINQFANIAVSSKSALANTPVAYAQGSKLWNDSTGQQAICRGTRDWGTFISALIGYDDFIEYWKDIFVRYNANICHYTDIDGLLKRLNAIRKQIREAFYACADTNALKATYYKLEAELFFLRKYINTNNGQFLVVPEDKVQKELKNYFVLEKNYFSEQEISDLFNQFKAKYSTRLATYKNCRDATWQNLMDKWNEFRANAGGFGPAIKQASSSITKRWERMANTPIKSGQSFFEGFLDARVNGLPAKEGLDLIVQELQKNMPDGYTFDQLQTTLDYKDKIAAENLDISTYLSQYQAQYAETADDYTFQIMSMLNQLDDIIRSTYPFENQTAQCVRRINNKQS